MPRAGAAALKCLSAAILLPWPATSSAAPLNRWAAVITEASNRFGLPPEWILRVIAIESGGRSLQHGEPITSRAGAMGLMQLMPGTWSEMRVLLHLGPNVLDPRANILAGTAYLRRMYDRFGYPGLFAAYNAGPGRYSAWLSGRRPLPPETRAYLAAAEAPTGLRMAAPSPSGGLLFAVAAAGGAQSDAKQIRIERRLFVPLATAAWQ